MGDIVVTGRRYDAQIGEYLTFSGVLARPDVSFGNFSTGPGNQQTVKQAVPDPSAKNNFDIAKTGELPDVHVNDASRD